MSGGSGTPRLSFTLRGGRFGGMPRPGKSSGMEKRHRRRPARPWAAAPSPIERKATVSDTHNVMLVVPDPVTMDGTVLHGDVGDIVSGVHWAEAQAAAHAGLSRRGRDRGQTESDTPGHHGLAEDPLTALRAAARHSEQQTGDRPVRTARRHETPPLATHRRSSAQPQGTRSLTVLGSAQGSPPVLKPLCTSEVPPCH